MPAIILSALWSLTGWLHWTEGGLSWSEADLLCVSVSCSVKRIGSVRSLSCVRL